MVKLVYGAVDKQGDWEKIPGRLETSELFLIFLTLGTIKQRNVNY